MRTRTHTPFNEDEFRRQWAADIGVREIGEHFGRSRMWTCKHARRLGLTPRAIDATKVPWGKVRYAYTEQKLTVSEIVRGLRRDFPTIARATIRRYLQSIGVPLRKGRGLARPDDVVRMRKLGLSYPEIGHCLGLTKTQVGHACRRLLGNSGRRGARPKVDAQRLIELRAAGMSLREIGAEVGLCHGTVAYHLGRSASPVAP